MRDTFRMIGNSYLGIIFRLARYPGPITTSGTSSRVSRLTIKVDVCAGLHRRCLAGREVGSFPS